MVKTHQSHRASPHTVIGELAIPMDVMVREGAGGRLQHAIVEEQQDAQTGRGPTLTDGLSDCVERSVLCEKQGQFPRVALSPAKAEAEFWLFTHSCKATGDRCKATSELKWPW